MYRYIKSPLPASVVSLPLKRRIQNANLRLSRFNATESSAPAVAPIPPPASAVSPVADAGKKSIFENLMNSKALRVSFGLILFSSFVLVPAAVKGMQAQAIPLSNGLELLCYSLDDTSSKYIHAINNVPYSVFSKPMTFKGMNINNLPPTSFQFVNFLKEFVYPARDIDLQFSDEQSELVGKHIDSLHMQLTVINRERDLLGSNIRNEMMKEEPLGAVVDKYEKLFIENIAMKTKAELQFIAAIQSVLTPQQRSKMAALSRTFNLTTSGKDMKSSLDHLLDTKLLVPPHELSSLSQSGREYIKPGIDLDLFRNSIASNTILVTEYNLKISRKAKRVYSLKFDGDMQCSQVKYLTEEINAILAAANVGDKVVITLNTGGGTVTGYALASEQLMRLKKKGIELIICVDQIAASGGYMMASTADKLYASKFAFIGSIGVISPMFNFSERMQREGLTYSEITAGEFKGSLNPFKKPTDKDVAHANMKIKEIYNNFTTYLAANRPILKDTISKLATGDVWAASDALKLNLVDAISTSDEVLYDLRRQGYEVLIMKVRPRMGANVPGGFGSLVAFISQIKSLFYANDSSSSSYTHPGSDVMLNQSMLNPHQQLNNHSLTSSNSNNNKYW